MRRFHIYIGFIVWLLTSLFAVSCNDELEGDGYSFNSSSNLHILVPTILNSRGAAMRSISSEAPTYNATVDECQINDLRLYAFPVVENDGKLVVENLPAPTATSMLNENAAEYQLTITPGTYHIYVVANMSDVLSGQTIDTEDKLKKVVLNYGSVGKPGMPVCTNIPMIYEPEKDATTGKLVETKITPAGNKYTEVIANMKFTCVKVKLNLIFDPTQADVNANFGGKSILIDNIVANKLSPFTNLYWGGKFVEESLADGDYKTGIRSTQYTSGPDAPAVYYTDWEDHTSEAEANNKNDIVGKGNPTPAPIDAAKKWLFQSTYYLPERYISSAADRSYLTINGKVANSASNNYRIDLGHKKDETSASEVPTFPRGTYYEITGRIKSLGNMALNCNVSIKPWDPLYIDADFNHTTLWVSKTEANVTSIAPAFINYESNAIITSDCLGCDTKIGEQPIIVVSELDPAKKQIKFSINNKINYSDYNGNYTGTAKVWIKAGNIKKYIDVNYDVTPYFDVTPQEITIYSGSDNIAKVIEFNTNLGGLEFTSGGTTSTYSTSEAKSSISYTNGSGATITSSITANSVTGTDQGTFSIKADQAVETSIEHTIYVQPRDYTPGKYGAKYNFKKPIKITVKPAVGNYYIYFRAINDRTPYNNTDGSKAENNYNGTLAEGGTNNWNDGWFDSSWTGDHDIPHESNHYLYAYTQIGETTTSKPQDPVWKYTEDWPGDQMKADYANPGWYYMYYDINTVQKKTEFGAEGNRKIKPGETLLMFNNNFNQGVGHAAHRCPHHLEPGIPLFDYEDHEGWIVFDPTTDAMWQAFDEKPEIENIKITLYTKFEIFGWYKEYGIATNGSFKIFDFGSATSGTTYTESKEGIWSKTVITLKAIKGAHEKAIRLYIDNSKNNSILLFDGRSFKDDTGYYEGGKWHQGKPDDVSE